MPDSNQTTDVSTIIRASQEKRIERNDLATQAARIIDPGAFQVWYDGAGPDARRIEADLRQRYMQAAAIHKAEQILKLAASVPALARRLVDDEIQGWVDLGVPMDNPSARRIVEGKYGL